LGAFPGRCDGVKTGGAELRVCGGLGLLPLCGRGRLCVRVAGLAGVVRVEDGRGRLLTPSYRGGPDPVE